MKKTAMILIMFLLSSGTAAQAAFFDKEKAPAASNPAPAPAPPPSGPTFEQMMNQLSVNSMLWGQLNQEDKKKALDAVIGLYKVRDNIAILNSADFYSRRVDETIAGDPGVANLDLPQIVKILAVMEYDFYNGQNKEELAKKTLGDKMYEANRLRKMQAGMQAGR